MTKKSNYPKTIDNSIVLIGPYQYRVQIRKRGYSIAATTFETFDESLEYRDKILNDIRRGEYKSNVKAKHTTLGDVLERYADEVTPKICTNEKNTKSLQSQLLKIKSYPIGEITLSKLDVIHLQSFRDVRKDEGLKRKTIKGDLSEIRRVINYAQHEWHINMPHGNPVDVELLLKHISNDATVRKPIKDDDVIQKWLAACAEYGDGHSLHDLADLGLKTGMRRGQLVNLRWEDINLADQLAYVVNKDRKSDNEELIAVALTNAAVAVLKRIGEQNDGKVFFYTNADSVTKAFERVRNKNKSVPEFRSITPHTMRHTVVHKLKLAGVITETAKFVTGHKTTQMHEHYGKITAHDVAGTIEDF